MLTVDPSKRITAKMAMKHPWVRDTLYACNYSVFCILYFRQFFETQVNVYVFVYMYVRLYACTYNELLKSFHMHVRTFYFRRFAFICVEHHSLIFQFN